MMHEKENCLTEICKIDSVAQLDKLNLIDLKWLCTYLIDQSLWFKNVPTNIACKYNYAKDKV
jgi:hypothetical protein